MRQALLLVKSSLEAQGYTLIEFTLGAQPEQDILREMLETAWKIEGAAGGLKGYKNKALQGERPVEERQRQI